MAAVLAIATTAVTADLPDPRTELGRVGRTTTPIESLRPTSGFERHDPSNVIRHEGRFWVYYTWNRGDHAEVSVHLAVSDDGRDWIDLGQTLGRGPPGAWDESGTIAPFCVLHESRFHLFYTGFRGGDLATRAIGCAIADHPTGPWRRGAGNPVLGSGRDRRDWDSGMVGDSNVIFREGRWWLYYKGRRREETSRQTRVGVATAERLTGPFFKHGGNPLFAGHAFSVWRHRGGVAALCGEISPAIKWSVDGLAFEDVGMLPNSSTGLFIPERDADPGDRHGFDWGLDVCEETGVRGMCRFDCERKTTDGSRLRGSP